MTQQICFGPVHLHRGMNTISPAWLLHCRGLCSSLLMHLPDSQSNFLCFFPLCLLTSNSLPTLMSSFHPWSPPYTQSSIPVPEVNGLQEPSLAKRLRGTPERIELENYRLSMQREEELEEVPEETLAEHNLSSVLDKATDADLGSRYKHKKWLRYAL